MANYILVHGIRIAKDFVPETFGRLTTIGPAFRLDKSYYQVCECVCGGILLVPTTSLRTSNTSSCGCLRAERAKTALKKHTIRHGATVNNQYTPEYTCWIRIRRRCLSPTNKDYHRYGGRGILLCGRWQGKEGFKNFLEDMGNKPSPQHSIDRIDNDGNYCPENCRWATPKEQANNTRKTNKLEAFGRIQSLSEWAREFNMNRGTIRNRMAKGKTLEEILKNNT